MMNAGRCSCLSVFGLAFDATEREVHVLFSGCPGYVRCVVVPSKREAQKPYAFVQFDSVDNAAYATESRQGTTWEEGGPSVSIEPAKRDIPEHFGARQDVRALPQVGPNQVLPAKRPRYDRDSWNGYQQDSWGVKDSGGQPPPPIHPPPYEAEPPVLSQLPDDGPRTLHVGGLPPGIRQEDLDAFLRANFGDSIIGSKLSSDAKGKAGLGRAFVGFTTHPAAQEAQSLLQGFNWDGAVLHAEWARSEFKFGAGAVSKGGPPLQFERPGKGFLTQSSRVAEWPAERAAVGPPQWAVAPLLHSQGYRKAEGGGPRTLHFTNLPAISEDEFHEFIAGTFPDQVTSARFKETNDGRPPVAWVLFVDDFVAAQVAKTHLSFDWHDMQVAVQFARSELDPTKVRGAR